jgi:lactate permease
VAPAATGMVGEEGTISRLALKHSVAMVLVISLITLLQALVLKWMLPYSAGGARDLRSDLELPWRP